MSRLPAKGPTDLEIVRALLVREPSEVAWTSFVECVQHDIYATCCNALPPSDVQSAYLEIFSQLKSNRVALLGKLGELKVGTEGFGADFQSLGPAINTFT